MDLHHLALTFQGGFVGRPCEVWLKGEGGEGWALYERFDTSDDNSLQTLHCTAPWGQRKEAVEGGQGGGGGGGLGV